MSRKWITGLVALTAVAGTAFAAASALSTGTHSRPPTATVSVDLSKANAGSKRGASGGTTKKPKIVYLESSTPTTINPAPPPAGIGPNVDVKLTGCSKVIDGGVVPSRFDVYQQGSYVKSKGEYHVLISVDSETTGNMTPFTIATNLTCLKGVK